ncbi:TRAP transporter large permease subunit [Salipiger abyssi]|uniref:TRAP transporter large permease subunit n=1 Tax=Salipiger abyssi TaxID=1250539 RepID=UPI001A8C1CFB|nr:TRAP transporter large permease subunit [Salipiger abyssi]MBN9888896.1 TRAP transporter large permease subunit [Salipiger abyssi]
MTALIGLSLLLAIFLLGLPIFVAFFAFNIGAAIYLMGAGGLTLFPGSILNTMTTSELIMVPLFILLGELLFRSGTIEILFDSVDTLIGKLPGREYVVVVAVSVLLGALSGSAIAVAALLGRTLLPAALDRGADTRLMSGMALGGACLAPIIPPSILIVIIGMLSGSSISQLMAAGVVPGVIAGMMFFVYIQVAVWRRSGRARATVDTGADGAEKLRALARLLPFSIVVFLVLGLILLGIATPTEAAATGVFGAVIVAAIFGKLSLRLFKDSIEGAVILSAMLLVIMATSTIFTQLLAFSGFARDAVDFVNGLDVSDLALFALLMLLPFVLCMFLDQIALLLILVPIYLPIIQAHGFDPVVFWTALLLNLSIGAITPPFGYALFALRAALGPKASLTDIYMSVLPVVAIMVALIFLIYAFPPIVTWLPSFL